MTDPSGPYQNGPHPDWTPRPAESAGVQQPGHPQPGWPAAPPPANPWTGSQQPPPAPGTGLAPVGQARSATRRRVLTATGAAIPVLGAGAYFVSRLGSSGAANPVVGGGGGGGFDPDNNNPSTLPSAAGDPNGISVSAVQSMLTKANQALKNKDQQAYTSLFTGTAATQAATLFKNLMKFEFAVAEYAFIGNSTRQFSTGSTATVGMDIAFTHQLADVDPGRVAEWYRWTLTKDGSGKPIITGLGGSPTVNASAKYVYYPHPWDSPHDIIVIKQGSAVMCAETEADAAVMRKFTNDVAAAVQNNRDEWTAAGGSLKGVSPGALFMFTPAAQLYTWYSGESNMAGYEAGLTTPMISADWLADPDGTVESYSGARIALNIDTPYFTFNQGENSVRTLAKHEDAHALVFPLDSAIQTTIPLWIVEGFADYMATRDYSQPVQNYLENPTIRAYAAGENGRKWSGTFPTDAEVYSPDPTVMGGSYGLSAMVFYYVASTHGMPGVVKLLTADYQAPSPDGVIRGTDNVAAAIQSALGISQDELESGWVQFVKQQLGVSAS